MRDITSARLLWLKGLMFVVIAMLSGALILIEYPSLRMAGLLALTVWGSCRAYYFAFYVIHHYIDPGYKFSGLGSFIMYILRRERRGSRE